MENTHHDVRVDISMGFAAAVLAVLGAGYVWGVVVFVRIVGGELSQAMSRMSGF